jgi:hypothetical protein
MRTLRTQHASQNQTLNSGTKFAYSKPLLAAKVQQFVHLNNTISGVNTRAAGPYRR